ncbi:MAG TPA: hypothetical protein VGC95_10050 [Chitinophagaceae bacterium]
MKNILAKSSGASIVNYTVFSKLSLLTLIAFFSCLSAVHAQSLRDSLFAGKLKADTSKTYVSKDTGKFVAPKVYDPSAVQPDAKKGEVAKLDESMPDSLNKNFYSRQKVFKRFLDVNTTVISQEASDTKKVKKAEYTVSIEYEIGLNGKITTTSVSSNPPNDYIVQQVTDLMKRAPTLAAPIYSDGQPRKLKSQQTITIVKK